MGQWRSGSEASIGVDTRSVETAVSRSNFGRESMFTDIKVTHAIIGQRRLLLCVLALVSLFTASGLAFAQSGVGDVSAIWVESSSLGSQPFLVPVTPSTPPESIAQALAARPQGSRGLLMKNFAEDVTSYDVIRLNPKKRKSATVPSPWLSIGEARVKSRVSAWLTKFAAAGGAADVFVVQCGVSLGVQRYAGSWVAINSDRRAVALKAVLGYPVISAAVAQSPAFVARWNALAETRIDAVLKSAISNVVIHQFPNAVVTLQRSSGFGMAHISRNRGFGTHDLVGFGVASSATDPLASIKACLSTFQTQLTASTRPRISWTASPASAFVFPDRANNISWWKELSWHLRLAGASIIKSGDSTIAADELAASQIVRAQLQQYLGSNQLDPSAALPEGTVVGSRIFASVAVVSNFQLVRISVREGVSAVWVKLASGQESMIHIEPGNYGAWFTTSTSSSIVRIATEPAAVIIASVPPPVVAPPVVPPPVVPPPVVPTPAPVAANPWYLIYDSFPGDNPPTIGNSQTYMLVGQYDVDASIATTGIIDPAKAIAQVERLIQLGKGSEWGVLDFEEPFDAIWNAGPSDPRYRPAMDSMVATIRALKARYPNIRWTYYGIPRVPYWFTDGVWRDFTPEQRVAKYVQLTAVVEPLMTEMDYFMPSVYDVYERAKGVPGSPAGADAIEASWRRANVEAISHWFQSRNRAVPAIIPIVSPWFQGGSIATELMPIPPSEFLEDQIRPLVAAGASGIAVWGAMRYYLYVAQWPGDHPSMAFLELRKTIQKVLCRDYLNGADPASVDWTSPSVGQQLGQSMNIVMINALEASWSARP